MGRAQRLPQSTTSPNRPQPPCGADGGTGESANMIRGKSPELMVWSAKTCVEHPLLWLIFAMPYTTEPLEIGGKGAIIPLPDYVLTKAESFNDDRQINLSNESIKNKHWCFQISKITSQKVHFGILIYILSWKHLFQIHFRLLKRNNKLKTTIFWQTFDVVKGLRYWPFYR